MERAVDDEEGEAVDCGPSKIFGASAAARGKEAMGDHEVERAAEELKGVEAASAGLRLVGVACDGLSVREGGAEEAWLVEREGEVADADGAEVGAGEGGSAAARRDGGDLDLDGAGEL